MDLQNIFEGDMIDLDNFEFILFTSFASPHEAIGLEMINCLKQVCKKYAKHNVFEHHMRLGTNAGSN